MKATCLLPIAASVLFGAQAIAADYTKDSKDTNATRGFRASQASASEFIGKKVTNAQDENLGKVQDVIINLEAGTAPYAIVATGGILGANRSRIAVPLRELQCSADGDKVMISATKEQFQAAATTATGNWAPVADTQWARKVDAYYGQPADREGFAREGTRYDDTTRTFVRDPVPKGAEVLMSAQDSQLCERICEKVEDVVHIRVSNGVTHLYGQVDTEEERKLLEAKVRAVPGVTSVQSHLKVKNP
jgi:sporulation protein YlmC with PRC-barrel domain